MNKAITKTIDLFQQWRANVRESWEKDKEVRALRKQRFDYVESLTEKDALYGDEIAYRRARKMLMFLRLGSVGSVVEAENASIVDCDMMPIEELALRNNIAANLEAWGFGDDPMLKDLLDIKFMPKQRQNLEQYLAKMPGVYAE